MTENKRFTKQYDKFGHCEIVNDEIKLHTIDEVVECLNNLHEEKEDWKSNCIKQVNENSILWNEISILREQGAEPSDAFKEYLDSISTKYEKFWNRKKEKAKEDGVIE